MDNKEFERYQLQRQAPKPHPDYAKFRLKDYRVPPGDGDAKEFVRAYLEHLQAQLDAARGIAFLGPSGTGKSMLATVVHNEFRRAKLATVAFLPLAEYVRRAVEQVGLQNAWQKYDDWSAYQRWDANRMLLESAQDHFGVLVLDDVGKEHRTHSGFAEDEFDYLIRHRYQRRLVTILTSNEPLEKWSGKYSASMQSFVRQSCEVVPVTGEDYRWSR